MALHFVDCFFSDYECWCSALSGEYDGGESHDGGGADGNNDKWEVLGGHVDDDVDSGARI